MTKLTDRDQATLKALLERQTALAEPLAQQGRLLRLEALALSPFVSGLGNEHPLENGFAFLNPYGLPYLPGSGVKGVLRRAASELAGGMWENSHEWDNATVDALFGQEIDEHGSGARRGALQFWDVIPQIDAGTLAVDVMTPHQSHYYQRGEPPHDSGQPIPVYFLTVPPKSRFVFHVQCDPVALMTRADLAEGQRWQQLLRTTFFHAFEWLGFGAKTSVGYGTFREDAAAQEAWERQMREKEERRRRAAELEKALAGLPEDAAWVKRKLSTWFGTDNNVFLGEVEGFLAERNALSYEAHELLVHEVEKRWRGIMANPDAVEGKKRKPKFNDRPRKLAKRLAEIAPKRA
ncbi:MAG: type III-B CRISPR module RAMP protein Cmr6 [Steroidobacteraceae bacterium]|nr:type III-B CRISPR module RAMP protein Cmr6 [Steroidobacteraceae bacterium]